MDTWNVLEENEDALRVAAPTADTIRALYQSMKEGGILYDRVSECFNLKNCVCIYAEFRQYAKALEQLEAILKELNFTQNPAEE